MKGDGWRAREDRDPTERVERLSVIRRQRQQFARKAPAASSGAAVGQRWLDAICSPLPSVSVARSTRERWPCRRQSPLAEVREMSDPRPQLARPRRILSDTGELGAVESIEGEPLGRSTWQSAHTSCSARKRASQDRQKAAAHRPFLLESCTTFSASHPKLRRFRVLPVRAPQRSGASV